MKTNYHYLLISQMSLLPDNHASLVHLYESQEWRTGIRFPRRPSPWQSRRPLFSPRGGKGNSEGPSKNLES